MFGLTVPSQSAGFNKPSQGLQQGTPPQLSKSLHWPSKHNSEPIITQATKKPAKAHAKHTGRLSMVKVMNDHMIIGPIHNATI